MSQGDGAVRSYDFSSKNLWRRRAWNFIREHTTRDQVGICLMSREAIDADLAAQKGLKMLNVIAIERNAEACRDLRQSGLLVVRGRFLDAVKAWPESWPLSFAMADFCCGIGLEPVGAVGRFCSGIGMTRRRAMVINLMRGRESGGWQIFTRPDGGDLPIPVGMSPKHRGYLLLSALFVHEVETYGRAILIDHLFKHGTVRWNTYRSGSLRFDSLYMSIDAETLPWIPGPRSSAVAALRRRIIAIRAVRSRRMAS